VARLGRKYHLFESGAFETETAMPHQNCSCSISLLNSEAWDGLAGRNPAPIEAPAETHLSARNIRRLFTKRGYAHFTRKSGRRFGSHPATPGIGNEAVRAGARESASLARDARARAG
jgi:hypothetical protein